VADWIGWGATALFASSYFCREASSLRRVQAVAATTWMIYGVIIAAPPVVVSNFIVATLALLSVRPRREPRAPGPPVPSRELGGGL
jgi:hypothetical protein